MDTMPKHVYQGHPAWHCTNKSPLKDGIAPLLWYHLMETLLSHLIEDNIEHHVQKIAGQSDELHIAHEL